jgi:hypothetical protein
VASPEFVLTADQRLLTTPRCGFRIENKVGASLWLALDGLPLG